MEVVRGWLREQYLPVVLVAATPAAEAICAGRNGLSVVDLLRTQATVSGFNGGPPGRRGRPRPNLAGPGLHAMQLCSPAHAALPRRSPTTNHSALPAVPMRVGEFSSRITELELRLHSYSTAFQPPAEVRAECMHAAMGPCGPPPGWLGACRCAAVLTLPA